MQSHIRQTTSSYVANINSSYLTLHQIPSEFPSRFGKFALLLSSILGACSKICGIFLCVGQGEMYDDVEDTDEEPDVEDIEVNAEVGNTLK